MKALYRLLLIVFFFLILTPAHSQKKLFKAIYKDDLEKLEKRLKKKKHINKTYQNGYTALMYASEKGKLPFVKTILDHGALPNLKNDAGSTALMIALKHRHFEIAELLLEYNADPFIKNNVKGTALMRACLVRNNLYLKKDFDNSKLESVLLSVLVQKDKRDSIQVNRRREMVKILLKKGLSVEDTTIYGATPLMFAANLGDTVIFNELLRYGAGKTINEVDLNGNTAISYAIVGGNLDIVKPLVEAGANPEAKLDYGLSHLMIAIINGHMDIAHYLMAQGVDLATVTPNGFSALTAAVGQSEHGLADTLIRLTSYKMNIDSTDGNLLLFNSALYADEKMDSLLLANDIFLSKANLYINKADSLYAKNEVDANLFYLKAIELINQFNTSLIKRKKENQKIRFKVEAGNSLKAVASLALFTGKIYAQFEHDVLIPNDFLDKFPLKIRKARELNAIHNKYEDIIKNNQKLIFKLEKKMI